MTTTHDVPMHTAAWEIRYPSKEPGFEDVKYHGTNAVADYRDHVHPEAYARELVYRSDADARCAKLQEESQAWRALAIAIADDLNDERIAHRALAEKVKGIDRCSATTQALIRMLIERDERGRQKYGATLDRTDLTHEQWLQHMAEEMLDGAGYALAAIRVAAIDAASGDQC